MRAESIDSLGAIAADVAMRSAVAYLHTHKLEADVDTLVACLRSHAKARLPEALASAKEAIEAGMAAMAEVTFRASMTLAGIEAAKEATALPVSANGY